MKKFSIRIFSALLALVIAFSSMSFTATAAPVFAKLSEDGKTYSRLSDGEYIDFYTDFDDVVDVFKESMLNRVPTFSVKFATCDPQFSFNIADADRVEEVCLRLINKAMVGAFEYDITNPYAGDFLFQSINVSGGGYSPHYSVFPTTNDVIDGVQYYAVEFGLTNVDYYSTPAQDDYFHKFVEKFNEVYIDENDTDYEKVKIIYDFVVRNTVYDNDVRTGIVSKTNPRFKIAHTAYGAICGNIDKEDFAQQMAESTLNFDEHFEEFFSPAKSVEDQKIESECDWGLAVCEGYAKLFYALCISNGIDCHIVEGDYAEGVLDKDGKQLTDPHEWNYVLLDDGVGDDGYQWYLVDTTYSCQKSLKKIDYNNYDYFLVGTDNENMAKEKHPIPYPVDLANYDGVEEIRLFNFNDLNVNYIRQLHDWYNDIVCTPTDYQYPMFSFSDLSQADEDVRNVVLVTRSYYYNNEERTAYILFDRNGDSYTSVRVEIDENGVILESDTHLAENLGFPYRSLKDMDYTYHFMIPYVVNTDSRDITVNSSTDKNFILAGNYEVNIVGSNGSSFTVVVPITPLNMSNDENHTDNYSSIQVDNESAYTGTSIVPSATIIDGFNHTLVAGVDYDIRIYEDPEHLYPLKEIKDMGDYYIRIEYKGNYVGYYTLTFKVGKIDLSKLSFGDDITSFSYIPVNMRQSQNINDIVDYYSAGASGMAVGDISVLPNTDYLLSFTPTSGAANGLSFGSTGKLYLTGAKTSENVVPGSQIELSYAVDRKFDISNFKINNSNTGLNNLPACSTAFVYTGKPIKPARAEFDNLNKYLNADECDISYQTECTNAGKKTLTVRGKDGCSGTASMYYVVQKKALDPNIVSVKQSGTDLYVNLKYNGMTLTPNVDYTVKKESDKITITATENSNYYGTYIVNSSGVNLSTFSIKYGDPPAHTHTLLGTLTPATTSKNGKLVYTCKSCGQTLKTQTIYAISSVKLSATKYTYDGNIKKPTVTVTDSKGNKISSSNYTVTYSSGRKNVGKYTVKVTFKDSYSGTVSKTFTIVPKSTTISSLTAVTKGFTVKWKKQSTQTTGYQIQIATDSKFTKGAKTYTVSSNSTVSKKITGLTAKKKYYVRVRTYKTVSGTKYYSSWSGYKTVTTKGSTTTQTVYRTKTGKCYHSKVCGSGSYYKVSLTDAKKAGLKACSKCY